MHPLNHRFNSKWRQVIQLYITLLLVGVVAIGVSLFTNFGVCILYSIVGIPCPACGMTRAFFSLPNIRQAFFFHPLFFTVPLVPFMALASPKVRNIISAALIALFIGVWVVRMVTMFPHTPPMNYNYGSWLQRLLDWWRSVGG